MKQRRARSGAGAGGLSLCRVGCARRQPWTENARSRDGRPPFWERPGRALPNPEEHRRPRTFDTTLYAGIRLWQGAELWITPEIDQGFGFADTHGVAGFPTGDELCCRSRSNKTSAVKRGRRGDARGKMR